jgi:filamentous hemagglutinin
MRASTSASRGCASLRAARPRGSPPRVRLTALAAALAAAFAVTGLAQAQGNPPMLPGTVAGRQVWSGAQVVGGDGVSELLIRQNVPRAQLHWDRFDIDRGQTVRFDQQGNRNWVALNWIADARPSEIAGRLVADGQVYLINQNGIIFKPGAQIDASSFIASTLAIQNDAFVRGLTALRDGRAAFEMAPGARSDARIEVRSGPVTTLDGRPVTGPDGQQLVEAARITSADGGRVFLFATREVVNQGLVSSPNGQVVLAAGRKVYLFAPRSDDNASFRGLFVEVDSGGEARNLGTLVSERGNVSMVGLIVNQGGRISADSALSGNGSVWLLARSDLPPSFDLDGGRPAASVAGEVTLGPRSEISLQSRSQLDAQGRPPTAIDAQPAFPSQIRIEGRRIVLSGDGAGGASIVAPGGRVSIAADTVPPDAGVPAGLGEGRVYVGPGSRIDVSGVREVQVPVTRNVVDVELRGENLGDTPALRSPGLEGSTLRVDVRDPATLLSRTTVDRAAAQQVARTVEERAGAGGTVSIRADGDVLVDAGARFGLSGGSVRYLPGVLDTSTLFDGQRTVSVSAATPDRTYRFADRYTVTDPRWGVTRSWDIAVRGRRDPGYVDGLDAGSLSLDAPFVTMNGLIEAEIVVGDRQRAAPPVGALLSFGNRDSFLQRAPDPTLRMPVVFGPAAAPLAPLSADVPRAAVFGDPDAPPPLHLDVDRLRRQGVSRIETFTRSRVDVPSGSRVELAPGGRLTVAAGEGVTVRGDVVVPGARDGVVSRVDGRDNVSRGIDLSGNLLAVGAGAQPDSPRDVRIEGATVSAAGQWVVDDRIPDPAVPGAAAVVQGGSVRLASPTGVHVDRVASLDASAGARLGADRRLNAGAAGRIEVIAADAGSIDVPSRGAAVLDGALNAYGFTTGGSLRIDAPAVAIGGGPAAANALRFEPDRFSQGGFADIELRGVDALTVAPGASISPVQRNRQVIPTGSPVGDPASLQASVPIVVRPDLVRRPVSVALRAPSVFRGTLNFAEGAALQLEPAGRLTLEAGLLMDLSGRLSAPAGQISLSVGRAPGSAAEYRGFRGTQGLYLGSAASVAVDGVDATGRDQAGRIVGDVLPGGRIAVDAWDGVLVVAPGARLSARGASGIVPASSIEAGSAPAEPRGVATDGGTVRLGATNGGALAGRVDVSSGGAGAQPGDLVIAVPALQVGSTGDFAPVPSGRQTTAIVADGRTVPAGARPGVDYDELVNGPQPGSPQDWATRPSELRVARGLVEDAGRARLTLEARDRVAIDADTALRASRAVVLDAPQLHVDGRARLAVEAPYVSLGNTRATNLDAPAPRGGEGQLQVRAGTALDLTGSLALSGMGSARLSSGEDLRMVGLYRDRSDGVSPYADGDLRIAGAIELVARRLFPATFGRFSIEAQGESGTIRTVGTGEASEPPLSAGGSLRMTAATIDHGGRLYAPQGSIDLDASGVLRLAGGSIVSVAGGAVPVPLGRTQDLRNIRYPFTDLSAREVLELPKAIELAGRAVTIEPGARVDASGGGDVQAVSFVAGSRGAFDLLQRPNVFAVLPGLQGAMPRDAQAQRDAELARDATNPQRLAPFRGAMPATVAVAPAAAAAVGDQVWLSGSATLPEGLYTLLPARYALLPGAAVVVATASRDAGPVRNSTLVDGSSLVAGYRAAVGVGATQTRWQTFNVLSASVLASYGEYLTDSGNRFFAADATRAGQASPRLPADAGRVSLVARGPELRLEGSLALSGAGGASTGRSGEFELAAQRIAITAGAAPAADGVVTISGERLAALQAERLLIGGRSSLQRDVSAPGSETPESRRTVQVTAAEVRVEPGAVVSAQEVALAANATVAVAAGARIVASEARRETIEVQPSAGAAFLAVTGNTVQRLAGAPQAGDGRVELAPGATLAGPRVLIAAPGGVDLPAEAVASGRALEIAAPAMTLGAVAPARATATVSAGALQALAGSDELVLRSREAVRIRGGTRIGGPGAGRIMIDAPGLQRVGEDAPVSIQAGRIELGASTTGIAAAAPDASAAGLTLTAQPVAGDRLRDGALELGPGMSRIAGFGDVAMRAESIRFAGDGGLSVTGNLLLEARAVVAATGATHRVDVDGVLRTVASGSAAEVAGAGHGARIDLSARRIDHGGTLLLPSGTATLRAAGPDDGAAALLLRPGSRIGLPGAVVRLEGVEAGGPGGRATLVATNGDLIAEPGSVIDVAASTPGTSAGTIVASAVGGRVSLAARLDGAAAARGAAGSLSVDGATLEAPSSLAAAAAAGGFGASVSLRSRTGNLELSGPSGAGPLIAARRLEVVADRGSVSVSGATLSADGDAGGSVRLVAGDRLSISPGSAITARGASGAGGQVELLAQGGISVAPGVTLDVSGATAGGTVDLRAPRPVFDSADGVVATGASFVGAGLIRATSVLRYVDVDAVTASAASPGGLALTQALAAALAATTPAAVAAIGARLGLAADPAFRLRPEVEVVSRAPGAAPGAGNLTVTEGLDFSTARFTSRRPGDTAGVLTLRAQGDLLMPDSGQGPQALLNDAFGGRAGGNNLAVDARFMGDAAASWSYRLVAGADAASADPGATRAAADPALRGGGHVVLGLGQQIRTGTGDIRIEAARDIVIGAAGTAPVAADEGSASVYTAGRAAAALPGFTLPSNPGTTLRPDYATGGGDVTLRAGGSITAAASPSLASSWLFRSGEARPDGTLVRPSAPVSWWPEFRYFTGSAGALGGGTVRIEAAGDLRDVSAAVGSSGRIAGPDTLTGALVVDGGGRLEARAGGDVSGGSFTVMRGTGSISAGESVTTTRRIDGAPVHTLLALGDAQVAVQARRSLTIDRVYNPTLAPQRIENARTASRRSHFSTYADDTSVTLTSLSGSIELSQSDGRLADAAGFPQLGYNSRDLPLTLSPGRYAAYALGGDIRLRSALDDGSDPPALLLAPSPRGQLELFATGSVLGSGTIVQSDADPVLAFGARQPFADVIARQSQFEADAHAPVPVHRDDPVPSRIIAGRDVTIDPAATTRSFFVTTAEALELRAGRDVRNLALRIQNARPDSVTRITAGRDVVNETRATPLGQLSAQDDRGTTVTGPGRVEVHAARDIAMGTSRGIVTRGNLENAALPDRGASITLVAGLPEDPAYDAFLARYVDPAQPGRLRRYDDVLIDFVARASGTAPAGAQQAFATLSQMPAGVRGELARAVFFLELRDAGRAASDPKSPSYRDFQPAYDAMAALFPADGAGNVDLVFSQVKTERGGDVQLLVPGIVCRGSAAACSATEASAAVGNVFVGLTSPPPELTRGNPPPKAPGDLGVFTLQGGEIQGAVGNDVAVNRSRMLTVAGGGIMLFSALGDIDAGRGSKSATTAPPPLVRVDRDGNVVVELPGVVEGSGIGVLVTQPGIVPGDIDLFAPKGVIDAGEAGIRAAGNITVFATQVLNASNISIGGASTGVPVTAPAANLSLASTSSSAAATARSGTDAAERAGGDAARPRAPQRLMVLEFLGFGDEGEEAYQRRRPRGR